MAECRRYRVYLAGNLTDGWQGGVIDALGDRVDWFDPRTLSDLYHQGRLTMQQLVETEMAKLREADIVFAYLAPEHTGAAGTPAEIGAAHALGKFVVLVDGRRDAHTEWLRYLADWYTGDLAVGIDELRILLALGLPALRRRGLPAAAVATLPGVAA